MNRLQTMARWLAWSLLALMVFLPGSDANPPPGTPKSLAPADEECLPKDPPPPVLKLKVRVPAFAPGDQTLVYKICVENCSTSEAHHVVVKDLLPPNVKFLRSDPEPSKIEPELQWPLGTIGAGAAREITLVLQPITKEDVKNCIRVQFEHGLCLVTRRAASVGPDGTPLPPGTLPPISTKPDPPRINTDPPKVVPIPEEKFPGVARLKLDVQSNEKQYLNMASKYLLTLKNTGDGKATNVLLTAKVSDKLAFQSASDKGQLVDDQVAWFLGDLEPGATRQIELVVKGKEVGKHCLRVSARADRNVVTLDETVCTTFLAASAMGLEMVDTVDPVIVGGKTAYTTKIVNQGTLPLRNVRLKARIPPSLKLLGTQPIEFAKGEADPLGTWILFQPLPQIEVGKYVEYLVNVEAVQAGLSRFRIEVTSDDLESGVPVIEEESTRVYDDLPLFPGNPGKEPPR